MGPVCLYTSKQFNCEQNTKIILLSRDKLAKELVPFTQLVKVRGGNLVWAFPASDFHETFTRSSLALNMSRKLLLDS